MSMPLGELGGLAFCAESEWGTTPGSPTWKWLHGIRSTVGLRRNLLVPKWMTIDPYAGARYDIPWVDGEFTFAFADEKDMIGDLLLTNATESGTYVYTFNDFVTAPTVPGISLLTNYGGGGAVVANAHEWIHAGCIPNLFRFDLTPDNWVELTVGVMGKSSTKTAAGSASTPTLTNTDKLVLPGETNLATCDYGGSTTEIMVKRATLEFQFPRSGNDRRAISDSAIREPVRTGPNVFNINLQMEVNDETDNDTIDLIADWVAGTEVGLLHIGDIFSFSGVKMEGEFPTLENGPREYALTGKASGAIIVLEDNIT